MAFNELIFLFKRRSIYPYYHLISNFNLPHIQNLYNYRNVEQFEEDLDFLMKHYKPLNPSQLFETKIPKNSFLLTFDDGLLETYTEIFPILKKRNLKCIFFLNPNFVNNKDAMYRHFMSVIISDLKKEGFPRSKKSKIAEILRFTFKNNEDFISSFLNLKFEERNKLQMVYEVLNFSTSNYLEANKIYLNSSQINEMILDGQFFGGHTMSHPPLIKLNLNEQLEEIHNSVEWVKNEFNLNYSFFAFPFTDSLMSKELFIELFKLNPDLRIFGNSGLKNDIDSRIIQRFSMENPKKIINKQVVLENIRALVEKIRSRNTIKRNEKF
ncbi:MAG: hypothetical protein FGM14_01110 [Flavobacteriales bacterium]|nr:hypothetical protein [Flavobacteriales bacterium]